MADVVAGLLLRDGKVLLGLRKPGGKRGGLWEMPGGKCDENYMPSDFADGWRARELHETALIREWKEERGIDIIVGARIGIALLDLEVCFTVTLYEVFTTEEPKCLDHVELGWFDMKEAIERMPCSPALYMHWPAIRAWLAARPDVPKRYVPGRATITLSLERVEQFHMRQLVACQHELQHEADRCRHMLHMGTTCEACMRECAKCWDDCATASTYCPRPAPQDIVGVLVMMGVDMAAPYTEPKTTDYCVVCGESPQSGSHLPHGHLYVDPRFNAVVKK